MAHENRPAEVEEVRLDAQKVHALFMRTMFENHELPNGQLPADYRIGEGIRCKVAFHLGRLREHTPMIRAYLAELPDSFHRSKGGGMSFLQACMDRHGNQWAEHDIMDELFMLGMAIKAVHCPMPRQLWSSLPGGMPYVIVDLDPAEPIKL